MDLKHLKILLLLIRNGSFELKGDALTSVSSSVQWLEAKIKELETPKENKEKK